MLNAIVCGTTFGQNYLQAIKNIEEIKLVGIVGKGSVRSQACAEIFNVPLYTSIQQISEDVDVAFVIVKSSAIGGAGTELALNLLEKGIHVMQEHPIHNRELESCFRLARKNELIYKVGNLYTEMKTVKVFLDAVKYLNYKDNLKHIDIFTSSQLLYSLIAILVESLPSFNSFEINNFKTDIIYPFNRIIMEDGEIKINLQVHNEVSDKDSNNHMHILHRINFFYQSGRLELEDTFGPCTWRNRMNISDNIILGKEIEIENYTSPANLFSQQYNEISNKFILEKIFPEAIANDIRKFLKLINDDSLQNSYMQKEIFIAKRWKEITDEIGFPENRINDLEHKNHYESLKKIMGRMI